MREPFRIDDSRMPVRLGSALKVPSYAYPFWGIPLGWYRDRSEELYSVEWEGGSPRQMQYVIDAITRTGLGNYSQMLRDEAAKTVSRIVQTKKGRVNILEPGAGISTEVIYKKLHQDGVDLDRLTVTMIEPAQSRLEETADRIVSDYNLQRGKHLHVHVGKDTDTPKIVAPSSQDIIVCVAQIHHHAYLDTPLTMLYHATAADGFLVTADWHNSLWEHPSRVYDFLRREFEWETKDEDLAAFRHLFPQSTKKHPETSAPLVEANNHIRHFWKGWAKVRAEAIEAGEFEPEDDILMLEAHRPVRRYRQEMEAAGYELFAEELMDETPNPQLLIDGNEILTQIIAQKPQESLKI